LKKVSPHPTFKNFSVTEEKKGIFYNKTTMRKNFKHFAIGEEIRSAAGGYIVQKEALTKIGEKEILYYIASAFFDTSCCGAGGCGYAIVVGYVADHQFKQDKNGTLLTEVETIESENEKEKIKKILLDKEKLDQVVFL
jgi:hypothetical protein